ncbi:MAG TPA: hypothetical protein VF494_11145 [Candidatus Limnocylindrales bacterium]
MSSAPSSAIAGATPRPTSPLPGRLVELPVSVFASPGILGSGDPPSCAVTLIEGPIYLRAIGDRVVGMSGDRALDITWPIGFRAVFNPDFTAVITDSGRVWALAGDNVNPGSDAYFRTVHACGLMFW